MKKIYTSQDRTAFEQNRSLAASTLRSIESSLFARTESYLDEIVNSDGSTNNEKAHAFAKRLVKSIEDELTKFQCEMYESFLYCTFICMERNLLPSFENIIALARNTEIYWQSNHNVTHDELAKDKFIPRFGLSGITDRLSVMLESKEELPEEEYIYSSEPSYYGFCRRFGYGTYCHAAGRDLVIREDYSDEMFYEHRNQWDESITAAVPDTNDFFDNYRNFIWMFGGRRRLFKAADIEKMIDIYLFNEGKSVLSTTGIRLNKLTSDLQCIDSNLLSERGMLEQASEMSAAPDISWRGW